MNGDAKHVWMQQARHTLNTLGKCKQLLMALIAAQLLLLALPVVAMARDAYVTGMIYNKAFVVDAETYDIAPGPGIQVGLRPSGIAITPDGSQVYVTNHDSDPGTVSVIDTDTGAEEKIGEPGQFSSPRFVSVTPDGSRAYVTNDVTSGTVSIIDTATNTVVGDPIEVGKNPWGIAITPDGSRAYVANNRSATISVIDTATNNVEKTFGTIFSPNDIAITPDGSRAYVTSFVSSKTVSIIDLVTDEITDVETDPWPSGIAVTPDGSRAYATTTLLDNLSMIDTSENIVTGTIGDWSIFNYPRRIAITPDGSRGFVANYGSGEVTVFDTETNDVIGGPIQFGMGTSAIAIVPNQGPVADFKVTTGQAGEPTAFDASDSNDVDGEVFRYDWDFGDGEISEDAGSTPTHTYTSPGNHTATLTVTDNEGGSTEFVSDGRTAYHNGGDAARTSVMFNVTDNDVESSPKPAPTPSTSPFITGQPGSCEKVLYENRLEVPREVELADLVTGKGLKVRASASKKSQGTLTVEITGRKARHFKLFGKNSLVKSKKLASTKVKVGRSQKNLYLLAKGRSRQLIKRALRLKGAPGRTKLKVSLTTHSLKNKRLKRLNTQTVRAVRRGKVSRTDTYTKVRQVTDKSDCGEPLTAEITVPRQSKLDTLTTRKGKKGRGTKVKVSCSQDCTASIATRMWGRYEVGLKLRKPGQKKNRLLSSRKVNLKAGETKTLQLKGVSSRKLRRLLVRGANKKRYKHVKLKYSIEARTSDGRRDVAARTSRVRLSFK